MALLPYDRQAMDYLIEDEILGLDDKALPVDDDGAAIWLDSHGDRRAPPRLI